MRRLSTVSLVTAGALAVLFGLYMTQATSTALPPERAQAGFAPNALLIQTELRTERYDAF